MFGGDPTNVTVVGHGTGAACVNFLLTSSAVPEGESFFFIHRSRIDIGNQISNSGLLPRSRTQRDIRCHITKVFIGLSFGIRFFRALRILEILPLVYNWYHCTVILIKTFAVASGNRILNERTSKVEYYRTSQLLGITGMCRYESTFGSKKYREHFAISC